MLLPEPYHKLLHDTAVADIFISEKMFDLSLLSLRLYLFLLMLAKEQKYKSLADLSLIFAANENEIKKALVSLSGKGLIDLSEDYRKYSILDIKARELSALIAHDQAKQEVNPPMEFTAGQRFMQDLSLTFFHGNMSPAWYRTIEEILQKYRFEPQVIYSLIKECAENDKIRNYYYFKKVAEAWFERGIQTFNDLIHYKDDLQIGSMANKMVGNALRRNLTVADINMIGSWISKYKYGLDVIEYLLSKTPGLRYPTVASLNTIISGWHEKKLGDLDAIKAYEASSPKPNYVANKTRSAQAKPTFSQREFDSDVTASEDFFAKLRQQTADNWLGGEDDVQRTN